MFAQGQMKMAKAPEMPLVPYMRYSRKMWAKVRADNPSAQLWDISKIIGAMWQDLPEAEKSNYNQEYEIEKMEYEKAMKHYNSYQQLQQKGKMPQKMSRGGVDVGAVVIQPIEEDGENNEITARRVSAIRFDRNHRLITELLNANIVNTKTIVAQSRVDMLQKHADKVVTHQKELEKELLDMEDKFNEKKREIEKASEEFAENLKRICDEKVVVEPSKYEEMVEEWRGKLADAYEEYKKKEEIMERQLASEREKMAVKTPMLYNLTIGEEETGRNVKETERDNGRMEEERMEMDDKVEEKGEIIAQNEESSD